MFSRPRMSVATLGIVSTLFLIACGSVPDENTNDENHIKGMDKSMAYILCKKNAEGKLKAPSTAKFAGLSGTTIGQSKDKSQWSVRTHVDSENSFGAMVRSQIICTIQPEGPDRGKVQSVIL